MSDSKIQWTEKTWNPVTGCTKVSAGCDHCYASTLHNQRFKANNTAGMQAVGVLEPAGVRHLRYDEGWQENVRRVGPPPGQTWAQRARELGAKLPVSAPCYDTPFAVVQCHEDRLREPMSWRKGAKVFTCSMGDIFHEDVPDAFLDRIFAVMALASHHTFQVLTKRPARMREYFADRETRIPAWWDAARTLGLTEAKLRTMEVRPSGEPYQGSDGQWRVPFKHVYEWPLPNVWMGTSVEDQAAADTRIPDLLATPAAVRFLSCEPLLGPVDLNSYADAEGFEVHTDWLRGRIWIDGQVGAPVPGIDWVIIGGESGAGARPMDLAWVRSLVAQCRAAGVAPFVKQLGAKPYEWVSPGSEGGDGQNLPLKLRDRHGGNWDEWPADLRVREFPGGSA